MLWDSEPQDWDWYNHDQLQEMQEHLSAEADDMADTNADAVLAAKKGSELLPNPLRYTYIKSVYDVAAELSAGSGEDADLVGVALFEDAADWDESVLRAAFDTLITTRRDVIEAVARYAHKLTMEGLA